MDAYLWTIHSMASSMNRGDRLNTDVLDKDGLTSVAVLTSSVIDRWISVKGNQVIVLLYLLD